MEVTVQGFGVVGSATAGLLTELGHDVSVHDPAKGMHATPRDVVVVCTPCPNGFLDDPGYAAGSRVVVRSTVRPDAFDVLPDAHHWPEFLSHRTADRDVRNPGRLVWGSREPDPRFLLDFLGEHYLGLIAQTLVCSPEAAALIKLATNAFYVTSVVFNNAVHDAFPAEYETVIRGLGLDPRQSPTHTDILADGYRGADGFCLPKDIRILSDFLSDHGSAWAAGVMRATAQANGGLLAFDGRDGSPKKRALDTVPALALGQPPRGVGPGGRQVGNGQASPAPLRPGG